MSGPATPACGRRMQAQRTPHPFRHPSTALNGACLDCGEHEEDGPHTATTD